MYKNAKYAFVFRAWDGDRVILCENEKELERKKIEYSMYDNTAAFKVINEKEGK